MRPRVLLLATFVLIIVAGAFAYWRTGRATTHDGANVVLISLDTLRADRLGVYGYERDTSPAIDAFSERAVVFERAVAPSSWTPPSHMTMLTGLHPLSHGVDDRDQRLLAKFPLLAEILSERGYRTLAITGGGFVNADRFGRGFESFRTTLEPFSESLAAAQRWIEENDDDGPWFAFLHTFDIHCPYSPPEPYLSMFVDPEKDPLSPPMSPGSDMAHCRKYKNLTDRQIRYLSGRYDGGVRWVDEALVPFFEFLERSDLLSRTVVVITSDHGEEFFEHGGSDHGLTLFREQLMIPLIIAAPDARAGRIEGLVGLSDVTPTVLDLAGQPTPAGLDGRSLARWIRGRTTGAAPSEAQVSTLIKAVSALQKEPARSFSWLDESEHLIVDEARHETWLFDLSEDEEETTNRAERTPERAARSTARLLAFRERFADRGHANVSRKAPSAAEAERLRSLGYIED